MWASDKGLCRPTDLAVSRGNPSKAIERLGWVAKHQIADIVRLMIEARQDRWICGMNRSQNSDR
jgi:GDPmannose 4,6-dehydratase